MKSKKSEWHSPITDDLPPEWVDTLVKGVQRAFKTPGRCSHARVSDPPASASEGWTFWFSPVPTEDLRPESERTSTTVDVDRLMEATSEYGGALSRLQKYEDHMELSGEYEGEKWVGEKWVILLYYKPGSYWHASSSEYAVVRSTPGTVTIHPDGRIEKHLALPEDA